MLADLLENTLHLLRDAFYERLLQGKIREAKETIQPLYTAIKKLQTTWTAERTTIQPEKAKTLDPHIHEIITTLTTLCATAQHELATVTNENFAQDPETWNMLFASTFESLVHELTAILHDLREQLIALQESKLEEEKIHAERTPTYLKIKARFNQEQQDLITRVENKIIEHLSKKDFRKKITDKIISGTWKGRLHAWLGGSFAVYRIIYTYENSRVLFEAIGTKRELGID